MSSISSFATTIDIAFIAPVDGDLSIELIAAPNLAVDSNDPPSGPRSAYVGVKVCNTGTNDLVDIHVNIGNYSTLTPGIYPSRTVTESSYAGTFSLEHVGDCDVEDGHRYMDILRAGDCYTQYWMIQYPIEDDNGNSVAGGNAVEDDLYLDFDVWVTADDGGTALAVDDTHRSYMRSMLSAAANKAWPNGTSKVPDEYLQIFEDSLGWRPDTTNQIAGCLFTLEGIWYDLGNINKGFDNDGDFVPDYNLFMQPVGNPYTFDNCCFRMIRQYGVLIIKLSGGGEKIIVFEDQFYHTNIPQNNTGGVGLVFYEYVPLSAPCAGLITPYQNVASGNNNEKYSGDFGITLGGPTSEVPLAILDKSGPETSNYNSDIEFSISINNTTNKALGIAQYYEALTLRDSIPMGTVYVAGSAAVNNTIPAGVSISVLYSTDNGLTYTDVEPTPSNVTDIAWVFNDNLPPGDIATVTLKVQAPSSTYTSPFVINEGAVTFGNGDPFFTDLDTVLLLGVNEIGGTVFSDNGGTTGILGNGIQEGNEGGIGSIGITLYFDINGNADFDAGDYYLGTTNTAGDGSYTFSGLPDGNFIVVLDGDDPDLPAGAGLSTEGVELTVNLNGTDDLDINFGYTPALQIIKSVTSDPLYFEARDVEFNITVKNLISSEAGPNTGPSSSEALWANSIYTGSGPLWNDLSEIIGCADGVGAITTTPWENAGGVNSPVYGTGISATTCGNITKVELLIKGSLDQAIVDDEMRLYILDGSNSQLFLGDYTLSTLAMNQWAADGGGTVTVDVTSATGITNWSNWDGSLKFGIQMRRNGGSTGTWDGSIMELDAIGIKLTTDGTGCVLTEACGGGVGSALTVRDEFSAYSYSNNDGTNNWSSDWIESEGDGPTAGDITINNPALRLVLSTGGSILRSADLTTAASASLSLIHRTQSGTGTVALEISNNNGSSWSTIESFSMSTDESSGVAVSYDITSYLSSINDISIRILHSGGTGIKSFDDIQIEYIVGSSSEDCNVYDLYINFDDNGAYAPQANIMGAPDGLYGTSTWGQELKGGSFNPPASSANIVKVEGVAQMYYTGTAVDDVVRMKYIYNTTTISQILIPTSEFASFNSPANAGEVVHDFTSERSWTWSDFDNIYGSKAALTIQPLSTSSSDGLTPYIDAVAYRVTTDETCSTSGNNDLVYNANSTLDPVPLVDMYDPDSLEFVTAEVYPDSIDELTGKLFWDDIGPIVAGDSSTVSVTFKPKNVFNNISGSATNMGFVNEALFGNGDMANTDTSSAQIFIEPTGSISGFVWSDANGNGWAGSVGYASPEQFIPGVTLTLYSCTNVANNGSCNGILLSSTTTTDENGAYLFEGLEANLKYYIEVDESTMPSSFVNQTGDPDDDPNRGSGNGGTCGTGGANARCDASWDNDGDWFEIGVDFWGSESWDLTEINFGYEINPIAYGVVWEDVNGNGVRELSEPGIEGVTVEFVTPSCTPGVNCPTELTDSNGDYRFENLSTANNNDMTVVQSTLPNGNTWTQTFESDGTINNNMDVDVSSGDIKGSFDFGFYPTGTGMVGDKVFYDQDGDGRFDSGEEGMPDISIDLYRDMNGNGILDNLIDIFLFSDITDASGDYSFSSLAEGDYVVVVDEMDLDFPSNVFQTSDPDEGGVCVACDGVGAVSVLSDLNSFVDFGYLPFGSAIVGDLVWRDLDGNQLVTSILEVGLSDISVNLFVDFNNDGTYVYLSSTSTDADGLYSFTDLADAKYTVVVNTADADFPLDSYGENMIATTPTSDTITIVGGQVNVINGTSCGSCNEDLDFGFAFPGAIGDLIFYDNNANATIDGSEEGIAGVTILLCYQSTSICDVSSAIASEVTDADGLYLFTGLDKGLYKVAVDESTLPSGITAASQTGDPDRDGVACDDNTYPSLPACDNQALDLDLSYGTRLLGVDFSYEPQGVIGDLVWLDLDQDGIQDSGEPGLGAVTVSLVSPTEDLGNGIGIPITIETDLSGNYSFGNLPDAFYNLSVTPPLGYTSVYEIDGTFNDQVAMTVSGGMVSAAFNTWCSDPEGCGLNLDFGYKLVGDYNISGVICIDDPTEDGVCTTAGEALQVGTVVNLYKDDGAFLGSSESDASGAFVFSDLPDGTYFVSISTGEAPYNLLSLTTDVFDTPASAVTTTGTSVYQTVLVSGSSITGLDFAFKFDASIDFGDLPMPYATLLGDIPTGAYHVLETTPSLFLGSLVDAEDIVVQNAAGTGDDFDGAIDDEDGVIPVSPRTWVSGLGGGNVEITASSEGWLVGYMDFNDDGDFLDAGELVMNQMVTTGATVISIDIPASVPLIDNTNIYSRFRLFEDAPPVPEFASTGFAINGEVEDHLIRVNKKRTITTNLFLPAKILNRKN